MSLMLMTPIQAVIVDHRQMADLVPVHQMPGLFERIARTAGDQLLHRDQLRDLQSERARAEELAAKKMRSMSGLDPQVQSRRLSGMLARKGYPPSVVYAVVRDTVNDAPEHRRD